MRVTVVFICLIAAVPALSAQPDQGKARMYKCVDGAGKVYYSDKMNPDCGQSSELNRQGVVMQKKESAKPGQPAKSEPTPATSREAKQQERRDRALIATYTSEEEIDAARDRTLALPAQGTKNIELKLEKANAQLNDLKKQADALATQKKPLPPRLLEEVNATQKAIAKFEAELVQRNTQSDAIRAKFEADKLRYRELKGASPN